MIKILYILYILLYLFIIIYDVKSQQSQNRRNKQEYLNTTTFPIYDYKHPVFTNSLNDTLFKHFHNSIPCKRKNINDIKPNEIHIIVFVHPTKDFDVQLQSMYLYAELYGYIFHRINPKPIIDKYKPIYTIGKAIQHWKGFYQLYMMKVLFIYFSIYHLLTPLSPSNVGNIFNLWM
jgi:hypothetical protein